jgi:hypothetical protein
VPRYALPVSEVPTGRDLRRLLGHPVLHHLHHREAVHVVELLQLTGLTAVPSSHISSASRCGKPVYSHRQRFLGLFTDTGSRANMTQVAVTRMGCGAEWLLLEPKFRRNVSPPSAGCKRIGQRYQQLAAVANLLLTLFLAR